MLHLHYYYRITVVSKTDLASILKDFVMKKLYPVNVFVWH